MGQDDIDNPDAWAASMAASDKYLTMLEGLSYEEYVYHMEKCWIFEEVPCELTWEMFTLENYDFDSYAAIEAEIEDNRAEVEEGMALARIIHERIVTERALREQDGTPTTIELETWFERGAPRGPELPKLPAMDD